MRIALTGTPGTGKTSISKFLIKKGFEVIDLNKVACEKGFTIGLDKIRKSKIVDIEKLNDFILNGFSNKDIIIIEGHLSHLLDCVEKVIILRCHPTQLRKNLSKRDWGQNKIKENLEAEILDVILCETINSFSEENIFEIDVTSSSIDKIASVIIDLIDNKFKNIKKYKIGKIDWSEEILKGF